VFLCKLGPRVFAQTVTLYLGVGLAASSRLSSCLQIIRFQAEL
jgi:hypothetical protein